MGQVHGLVQFIVRFLMTLFLVILLLQFKVTEVYERGNYSFLYEYCPETGDMRNLVVDG